MCESARGSVRVDFFGAQALHRFSVIRRNAPAPFVGKRVDVGLVRRSMRKDLLERVDDRRPHELVRLATGCARLRHLKAKQQQS